MVFTIGCEVRGGSGCLIPSVLLYCSCFRDDESALLRIEQTSMGKLHDFTWLLHPGCGASLIKIRITSRCVCTFLCRQNIKISKKNVLDKSWTLTFHRQPSASSGELRYVHQHAGRETGSHRETNYFRLFFCASRLFLAVVFFLCVR